MPFEENSFFYEFSDAAFPICYYSSKDCGYFKLYNASFPVKGKYDVWEKFGCKLDPESFQSFRLSLGNKKYFLMTSIAETSGRGTRDVFLHLFDITDLNSITHYPLWSLYGSHLSIGDYNNDGNLDFLEVRYDRSKGKDEGEIFKVSFKTLTESGVFDYVNDKYIFFLQEFKDDGPKITVIEKKW